MIRPFLQKQLLSTCFGLFLKKQLLATCFGLFKEAIIINMFRSFVKKILSTCFGLFKKNNY